MRSFSTASLFDFGSRPRAPVFSLDGAIGVGKSSVLDYIGRTQPGVKVLQEPVGTFTDFNGVNLLEQVREGASLFFSLVVEGSSKLILTYFFIRQIHEMAQL